MFFAQHQIKTTCWLYFNTWSWRYDLQRSDLFTCCCSETGNKWSRALAKKTRGRDTDAYAENWFCTRSEIFFFCDFYSTIYLFIFYFHFIIIPFCAPLHDVCSTGFVRLSGGDDGCSPACAIKAQNKTIKLHKKKNPSLIFVRLSSYVRNTVNTRGHTSTHNNTYPQTCKAFRFPVAGAYAKIRHPVRGFFIFFITLKKKKKIRIHFSLRLACAHLPPQSQPLVERSRARDLDHLFARRKGVRYARFIVSTRTRKHKT